MFYLYIVAHLNESDVFTSPIKIGVTNNLDRRIQELQTGNPAKIGLYSYVPFTIESYAYKAEKKLHEMNEIASLRGEWFDTEPENIWERFFCQVDVKDTIINHLNNEIENLRWQRSTLDMVLSEQEYILEDIFRSDMGDDNEIIFDKYCKIMCEKYRSVVKKIESLRSGRCKQGIISGTPYWRALAERKH